MTDLYFVLLLASLRVMASRVMTFFTMALPASGTLVKVKACGPCGPH